MKLVCKISSLDLLASIQSYVDGIMLEDAEDILEQIHNVEQHQLIPIYMLNEMVLPMEITAYKEKVMATMHTSCLYYITDLGLAYLLKKLELQNRTIYDPITMITNHLDAEAYMNYGFHAIGLSNEITIKDTKIMIEKTNCKAFLQVFGYRLMLNTRRRLVTLYADQMNTSIPLEGLQIEEITRKERYPITETEAGTKIYRGYILCLLKEILNLPLEYAYLDSNRITTVNFLMVVRIFYEVLHGKDISSAMMELESLDLPIQDGFSYQDSVYMKEEF